MTEQEQIELALKIAKKYADEANLGDNDEVVAMTANAVDHIIEFYNMRFGDVLILAQKFAEAITFGDVCKIDQIVQLFRDAFEGRIDVHCDLHKKILN